MENYHTDFRTNNNNNNCEFITLENTLYNISSCYPQLARCSTLFTLIAFVKLTTKFLFLFAQVTF